MSDWDKFNHNIGYAGYYENPPEDTTNDSSSTSCGSAIPSSTYVQSNSAGVITTNFKHRSSKPGEVRTFFINATFSALLISVLIFVLSLVCVGIFSELNEHYHILKDLKSYTVTVCGYSFLSCWVFAIAYAIVDPDH